ncbi:MAG TPA: VTT domain-containing protein [Polyangia bacterium]|jgi:uncharacterized membrane protein YdjX (TVP38/TMEM64 family)
MNRARAWRLGVLAGVLVALLVVRYATSFGASLSMTRVRDLVQHAGALGVAIFFVAFAVGELLHVPGLVFVAAAVMTWGRVAGGTTAYAAAIGSVALSFVVVRAIGGQPLAELRWRWLQRILARLDQRPIVTVALLRVLLWLAPALNYALALSRVRFVDYLVGSALGLIPPIVAMTLFLDYLMR